MNENKFKKRTFTETLSLVCKAKGGKLLKANGGINQSEVGRLAGIYQANVSRWFSNENHYPNNDNIVALAKAFKISPAQMRGELPIDFIDGVHARTAEDEILANEIAALPDNVKKLIRDQIAVYKTLNEKN